MPMVQNQDHGVGALNLIVPAIRVPDLGLFQRYLPSKWQMKLYGGVAELQADMKLSETDFKADIHLISDKADVGIKEYRFETDLDLGVSASAPELSSGTIDISGTYIRLGDFTIASKLVAESAEIQTSLTIETGHLELKLPELAEEKIELNDVPRVLGDYELETLLSFADAELEINGSMSDLSWISVLFKNSHNMAIGGSGTLSIKALLNSGWLAEGSLIEILPDGLDLKILDYHVQGDGNIRLIVTKGGEGPDLDLDMDITNASLKRSGEQQAFIEDVVIKLDAIGKGMSYDGPGEDLELHLQLPSAKVTDMAVFNQYFPEDSPLQLITGKADLTAMIDLRPSSAAGFVKLETRELQARIDNQEVAAGLSVDIKLADGVPKDLEFDISGSSILIDKVKVVGEESSFNDSDWHIRFDLNKGRTVWKKPVRIQAQADIEMKDTRPIVAMVSNHRQKNGWLEKMLTIEDLKGEATFELANEQIIIPYAFIDSEKLDVGAKAIINKQTRSGVIYARYGKLKGVLKIDQGKRNFDIIRAREKFDEYLTPPISK
ncbi:MAG: hypothetical protein IMF09_00510 [Proteobacteria bacterium]|nr:hypothetical protein [Pseudomonadota bacterium]